MAIGESGARDHPYRVAFRIRPESISLLTVFMSWGDLRFSRCLSW
jgi:hypothetical protein